METSSSEIVSMPRCARPFGKLRRIAKLAREMPGAALNTLAHHIDMDWMLEAFRRTLDQERPRLTARAPVTTRPPGRLGGVITDAHRMCAGCISLRGVVARPGLWGFRRSRTRCFNARSSWRLKPCTSRIFSTVRTAFVWYERPRPRAAAADPHGRFASRATRARCGGGLGAPRVVSGAHGCNRGYVTAYCSG